MKNKKPLIFLQDWGTYPFETIVVVGGTIKDIENFFKVKKFDFKEDLQNSLQKTIASVAVTVFDEVDKTTLVWFKKNSIKNMGIVAHEVLHLVNYVFKFLIITEEEVFAYQMEYLVNNILKKAKGVK